MTLNKAIYIVKSFKWPKYRLRFISLIGFCFSFCLCVAFFPLSLFWLCATFHRLFNCFGVCKCVSMCFFIQRREIKIKSAHNIYTYKRTHSHPYSLSRSHSHSELCCHFRTVLHSFNRIGSLPFSSLFVPFLSFARLHSILLCFKAEASHIIHAASMHSTAECTLYTYFAVWYRLRIYGQWARTQTTINNENKWVKQKQKKWKKMRKGKMSNNKRKTSSRRRRRRQRQNVRKWESKTQSNTMRMHKSVEQRDEAKATKGRKL